MNSITDLPSQSPSMAPTIVGRDADIEHRGSIWIVVLCISTALAWFILLHCVEIRRRSTSNETSTSSRPDDAANATTTSAMLEQRRQQREMKRQESVERNLKVHEWSKDCFSCEIDVEAALSEETAYSSAGDEDDNDDARSMDPMDHLRNISELQHESATTTSSSSNNNNNNDSNECIICLTTFKKNQLVCRSNHSNCRHLFHADCMKQWLSKHRRCPICRIPYLETDSS